MLITGNKFLAICLIAISIFLVYSHTLSYPWHFDDVPNIILNEAVQIEDLTISSLAKSFSAFPYTGEFSRPVSYLSLSINWYFGKDTTLGYHVINIIIHVLTAICLFYSIVLLLQSPSLESAFNQNSICLIALISVLMWSLHPIQIQAVTYIVQRMTSLAAFFFLLAVICYQKNFVAKNNGSRAAYLAGTTLFYLIASLSKENAALLPCSLLLIHFVFYSQDTRSFSLNLFKILTAINVLFIFACLYYLFSRGYLASLVSLEQIGNRPFSLYERVLTQPRIILFYLSLLSYPLPTRFSPDHSIDLSTSLFTPWSTLPAILLILALVLFCLVNIKRFPVLSFSFLFFLLNHIIESSIIPLELIFEHRNYLPSFFLFFPAAIGFVKLANYYKNRKVMYYTLSVSLILLISLVGWSTYLRNTKWATKESLWLDAVNKAPDNARPYSYLGQIYGWEKAPTAENYARAISYYEQALGKMGPLKSFDGPILGNIGRLYFNQKKYDEARMYYEKALKKNDRFSKIKYNYAELLILQEEFDRALQLLDEIIDNKDTINVDKAYNLRGLIHLWQEDYHSAVKDISTALKLSSNSIKYFYNMGVALSRSGNYHEAEHYLKELLRDNPQNILIMLSIIENTARSSKTDIVGKYAANLYKVFSKEEILASLKDPGFERYRSAPLDYVLIAPIIKDAQPREAIPDAQ